MPEPTRTDLLAIYGPCPICREPLTCVTMIEGDGSRRDELACTAPENHPPDGSWPLSALL